MTIGTITQDARVPVFVTINGVPSVPDIPNGMYSKKVWSGADLDDLEKAVKTAYPDYPMPDHTYHVNIEKTFVSQQLGYVAVECVYPYTHQVTFSNINRGQKVTSFDAIDDLPLIGLLKTRAILELQSKLNQGANLGVMIATDILPTAEMLALDTFRLYSGFRHALRGDFSAMRRALATSTSDLKKISKSMPWWNNHTISFSPPRNERGLVRNSAKNAGQYWLEYSYGWKPLLADIHELAKELAFKLNGPKAGPVFISTKASRLDDETNFALITWTSKRKYRCKVKVRLDRVPEIGFAELGLTDPLPIVWELLPWSFVVDWAYPLGDYLQASAFSRRLEGRFCITNTVEHFHESARKRMDVGARWDLPCGGGGWPNHLEGCNFKPGDAWSYRKVVSRSVPSTLDVPLPHFDPNIFGKSGGIFRAANAVSLLTNFIK